VGKKAERGNMGVGEEKRTEIGWGGGTLRRRAEGGGGGALA